MLSKRTRVARSHPFVHSRLKLESLDERIVPALTAVNINTIEFSGNEGSAVVMNSTVEGATNPVYAWSVTKDDVAFSSGTAADFSFTPDDNGTYVVKLSV